MDDDVSRPGEFQPSPKTQVTNNRLFFIAAALYGVALIASSVADLFFPGYRVFDGMTVFYGSLTGGLTLLTLGISYMAITVLIGVALLMQTRQRSIDGGLLWRRLIIGPLFLVASVVLLLAGAHILSKRVIVDEEGIVYRSLVERKEVPWAAVQSMDGNFVPGTRLGLMGEDRYAWVEFVTRDGETIRMSLRFMRAIGEIREVVMEEVV